MATIEQSEDFTRFVRELPDDKRSRSSIDELYDQWREQSRADEDLLAVQESLDDFKQDPNGGPRGLQTGHRKKKKKKVFMHVFIY